MELYLGHIGFVEVSCNMVDNLSDSAMLRWCRWSARLDASLTVFAGNSQRLNLMPTKIHLKMINISQTEFIGNRLLGYCKNQKICVLRI